MIYNLLAVNIGEDLPLGNGKNISETYSSVGPLVSSLLKNSLTLAGIIFLILILVSGVTLIAGAGSSDSKKIEQSKKTLTSSIIGFIVVFTAFFVIQIISVITGVKILNSDL